MKIAFLVNDVTNLIVHQTTSHLLTSAVQRGHEAHVMSVTDIGLSGANGLCAQARPIIADGSDIPKLVEHLHQTSAVSLPLESCDVLLIRTNPACDQKHAWAHQTALSVASMLKEKGVLVLNDPHGLALASNKLYLTLFPQKYRPLTLVSRDPVEIRNFVEAREDMTVLKPLHGTWGRDVFFVAPNKLSNLNQIVDVLTRDGLAMVQEFIPEAVQGDKRVVVCNGKILEKDGKAAAVGRVPGEGELRSNIHAGGRAEWPALSNEIREAVNEIGPQLVADGIFLAGLDFVGTRLVEINVFGIGGLQDMAQFARFSFTDLIIEAIEDKRKENAAFN